MQKGFLQLSKDLFFNTLKLDLPPTQKEMLLYIIGKTVEWPETRQTLQVHLSLRYIGKALNLHYQHISKALKELSESGFITVAENTNKKKGRIITLIAENVMKASTHRVTKSVTQKLTKSVTPEKTEKVKKTITTTQNDEYNTSVTKSVTKQETYIQKIQQQEPTATQSVVSNVFHSIPLNNSELIPIPTKTTIIQNHEEKENISSSITSSIVEKKNNILFIPENFINTVKESENNKTDEINEELSGIVYIAKEFKINEFVVNTGIKILKERNCQDVYNTIENIFNQMKKRNIKTSIPGYFLSMCQKIDLSSCYTPSVSANSFHLENNNEITTNIIEEAIDPEEQDKMERKAFGKWLYEGYSSGKIKYVLNPNGLALEILSMDKSQFCYRNTQGKFVSIAFLQLSEKMRNKALFVGPDYLVEVDEEEIMAGCL